MKAALSKQNDGQAQVSVDEHLQGLPRGAATARPLLAKVRPRLSVVITSYSIERLGDIFDVLDSLKAQTYPDIDVLFVAEKSRELCQGVKTYAQSEVPVRVVFHEGPLGMSGARNLGIQAAVGDIIAFIDDDAPAFPQWAASLVQTLADDSIIAVTGPAVPRWVEEEASWLPRELYWIISCTDWANLGGLRDIRNVWGMNMAFKREAFELAGGFSTNIGGTHGKRLHGEEVELSLRVRSKTGKRIVYNPEVKVMHKVYSRRLALPWIAKTSYWIGFTRPQLRRLSRRYGIGEDFLATERGLLGRTLRLLGRTVAALPIRPRSALRALRVTLAALLFVAVGYSHYLLLAAVGVVRDGIDSRKALEGQENG